MSETNLKLTGGAWITPGGSGRLSEDKEVALGSGEPIIPPPAETFSRAHPRYGRFDTFTRLGFAAAAMTLTDAGFDEEKDAEKTGMVISSRYGVLETDFNYYQTTLDQGGILSSPNLFSLTLPVIVLGEGAVYFKLRGPTICVGEDSDNNGLGLSALQTAVSMLTSGKAEKMIAGWIDAPTPELINEKDAVTLSGAVFVLLDTNSNDMLYYKDITCKKGECQYNGKQLTSLPELFK